MSWDERDPLLIKKKGGSVQVALTSPTTPLIDYHGVSGEATGFFGTMMNFLKGCVASGFLALPYALGKSGYAAGTAAMVLICLVSTHCVHLLVEVKEFIGVKHGLNSVSYGELARLSMGNIGSKFTNISLVVSQLGFCTVYALFYAKNMSKVFPQLSQNEHIAILAPCLVMLSWVKSLRVLAYPSALGTLCILYAAGVIYEYTIRHLVNDGVGNRDNTKSDLCTPSNYTSTNDCAPQEWTSIGDFPIMFGNSIYAFEAIGLVLPLQNAMKNKNDFGLMLNLSMIIVFLQYTSFALLGYLVFGRAVEGVITLNLPDETLYSSVLVALSVMMLQSYALQFFPAIEIMESLYLKRFEGFGDTGFIIARHVVRAIFVAITIGLAISIPNIGAGISLIGALGAGSLSLVLPPLIHYMAMRDQLSTGRKAIDFIYLSFGVIGSAAGTFVALKDIIETS
eukprot:m.227341 g.227341  ORF g.227341 m.227341 type:complete len:452 (-) comp11572_c0_seq1:92-1447(-)